MKIKNVALIILIIIPLLTFGQRDWEAVEIKRNTVTDNISFLEGSGGNIGVIHGEDGIVIVDDQYAPLSEKIKGALSEISDKELSYIINTHYHGDHVGGNENLSKDGAMIVGHDNVRSRLGTTFYSAFWDRDVEAKPETYWPRTTFSNEMTFFINGEEIRVTHLPNAHTDGDALIHFKTSNVMHTGDCFVRYGYPFVDIAAGGSIDGLIAAQKKILQLADENTKIIPGHGDLASIEDVKELLEMLEATRKIVADLKENGKSLDECISANPLAEFHERWNGNFITSDLFVRIIYETIP